MSSLKKIITAIIVVVILASALIGLAVPNINVPVQGLGVGDNSIVSPVSEGRYTLWTSGTTVTDVEIILSGNLSQGTMVYVVLRDSSGNEVSKGSLIVGSGGIPGGTPFNVSVSSVDISSVDSTKTEVILLSPEYNLDSSGPIFVNTQKLGLGTYDGRYSNPLTVHGSTVYLDYYPVRILLISRNLNFPWNSLYFTNSTGSCLYYWKEFEGTFVNSDGQTYSWAVFWVNVTTIPANGDEVIFVNYLGTGNPCSSYSNPNRVFLFYEDFDDLSDWNIGGSPTVSGGQLKLDGGDWIWSQRSFPVPYSVEMLVNLTYDDGTIYDQSGNWLFYDIYSLGPFILPYVDSSGNGLGEGIGNKYEFLLGYLISQTQQDGLTNFNVYSTLSSLNWNYQDSDPQYVMNQWEILNATVTSNAVDFSQVLFITWDGSSWTLSQDTTSGVPAYIYNTSSYYLTVTSDGRVAIGQWSGGPTYVDFLFVRKYVNPEPTYTLGRWYYHLTFVPEPAILKGMLWLSNSDLQSLGLDRKVSIELTSQGTSGLSPRPQNLSNLTNFNISKLIENLTLTSSPP